MLFLIAFYAESSSPTPDNPLGLMLVLWPLALVEPGGSQ